MERTWSSCVVARCLIAKATTSIPESILFARHPPSEPPSTTLQQDMAPYVFSLQAWALKLSGQQGKNTYHPHQATTVGSEIIIDNHFFVGVTRCVEI